MCRLIPMSLLPIAPVRAIATLTTPMIILIIVVLIIVLIVVIHIIVAVGVILARTIVVAPGAFVLQTYDTIIMFRMLKVAFSQNTIPCRIGIACQCLILFKHLLRRAAHFGFRPVLSNIALLWLVSATIPRYAGRPLFDCSTP